MSTPSYTDGSGGSGENERLRQNETVSIIDIAIKVLAKQPKFSATVAGLCIITIAMNGSLLGTLAKYNSIRNRVKKLCYLIANLSIVIMYGVSLIFWSILDLGEINMLLKGNVFCRIFPFQRAQVKILFPLSILALSYKQARKLESNLIKIKPVSMLLFIWGVATGTALLTTFITVGYNAEEQFCVDAAPELKMFVQTLIFLIFHVLVVGLLTFGMYYIRKDIFHYIGSTCLRVVQTNQLRIKIQTVRFLVANSVIFLLSWIPIGLITFAYEISRKADSSILFMSNPTWKVLLCILVFLYTLSHPIIMFNTFDCLKSERIQMTTSYCRNPNCTRHPFQGQVTLTLTPNGIAQIALAAVASATRVTTRVTRCSHHRRPRPSQLNLRLALLPTPAVLQMPGVLGMKC